jgi:hypothetical protein
MENLEKGTWSKGLNISSCFKTFGSWPKNAKIRGSECINSDDI